VLRDKKGLPKGTIKIDGDLDAERTLIVDLLRQAGLVTAVVMEPGMGPTTTAVNDGGDRFSTDGMVAVVVLKHTSGPTQPAPTMSREIHHDARQYRIGIRWGITPPPSIATAPRS